MTTTKQLVQDLIDKPFTPEQRADLQSCVSNEADFGFQEVWSGINEGVNDFVGQITFDPETDEPLCEEGTDEYKQLTETLREKAFALITVKDVKVEATHQTATNEQQQAFTELVRASFESDPNDVYEVLAGLLTHRFEAEATADLIAEYRETMGLN